MKRTTETKAEPMRGTAHNGSRTVVDFPFYTGFAGLSDAPGPGVLFAYLGRLPADQEYTGTIDGTLARTTKISKSKLIDGMVAVEAVITE